MLIFHRLLSRSLFGWYDVAMISAVIFDMDGLLIDSEPLWRRAQIYAFAKVEVKLNQEDMHHTMGRRVDEVVEHWYNKRPWKGMSQKDIEKLIVDKVIKLIKSEGARCPGVQNILEFFKKKSIPMAVASSSSDKIINVVIDSLNIRDYFGHIYSAQHEKLGKPQPDVYKTAVSLLNVKPYECLVFEDSPSGVQAAKAAKMKCVAVPDQENKSNSYIQQADAVIDSLKDFDEKLFKSL